MSIVRFYACDTCREVCESRAALHRHVQQKHSMLVPDTEDLHRLTTQLHPVLPELLRSQRSTWATWGELTFRIAYDRDAGPERLAEAVNARQQLESVIRRWRPSASVFIFGSSVAMGVWDGLSDIDFTVIDVDAMEAGEWPPNERNAVRGVANHLRRIGFAHPHLEAIEHARVPIIKHTAPSAFASSSGGNDNNSGGDKRSGSSAAADSASGNGSSKFEGILSRSVRFLFDTVLDEREMAAVELAVKEQLGGAAPERVWWDVSSNRHTMGITAPTTTQAVQLLISPPSSSSTPVLQKASSSSSSSSSSSTPTPLVKRKVPVAALPVHSDLRPELYRIDFDLSFRAFGVRNSLLLRHYLVDCGEPCARPGALVLKDWSKTSGVNDSMHGYLTSYAINILWIYFLVQRGRVSFRAPESVPSSVRDVAPDPTHVPLVPKSILALSRKRIGNSSDYDSNNDSNNQTAVADAEKLYEQMGRLLVDFFAFYVFDFNWEKHVVSLNRPGITTKQMLRWAEVDETTLAPGGGGGGGGGLGGKNTRYDICIEDPYEDNLNLGRHIGAVRSFKFHDEFRRALLALVKGDVSDSCIVPTSVAAAFLASKKDEEQQQHQHVDEDGAVPAAASASSSSTQVEDLTAVLQVALDVLEGSTSSTATSLANTSAENGRASTTPSVIQQQTTTAELRAALVERAPDAFERVRNSMGWVQLMRALGLRVVGDVIRPFRSVSAMKKKTTEQSQQQPLPSITSSANISSSNSQSSNQSSSTRQPDSVGASQKTNTPPPHHTEYRKEIDFVSLDLSDRILATFVRDLSLDDVELLPTWMKLTPQQQQKLESQQQQQQQQQQSHADDIPDAPEEKERALKKSESGNLTCSDKNNKNDNLLSNDCIVDHDENDEFITLSCVNSAFLRCWRASPPPSMMFTPSEKRVREMAANNGPLIVSSAGARGSSSSTLCPAVSATTSMLVSSRRLFSFSSMLHRFPRVLK